MNFDNSSNYNDNFEKIKKRADLYGYNINYGRVRDNNNDTSKDLLKIVIAGGIIIGGFFYIKNKFKKIIKNTFDIDLDKKPDDKKEKESIVKKSKKQSFKFDKSEAIDVDYIVRN